jgi:hypothetical protein
MFFSQCCGISRNEKRARIVLPQNRAIVINSSLSTYDFTEKHPATFCAETKASKKAWRRKDATSRSQAAQAEKKLIFSFKVIDDQLKQYKL